MSGAPTGDWRRQLRRKIGWLLLIKLLGLVALRSMFFSGEHRQQTDEASLAQRLGVERSEQQQRSHAP